MHIYQFCLYFGFVGIAAMAFLGLSHSGGHHAHGSHSASHTGHDTGGFESSAHDVSHGAASHGAASHAHAAHHGQHQTQAQQQQAQNAQRTESMLAFLSPRVWFSVALGFGAAGTLGEKAIREPLLFLLAALCGLAFEFLLFRPLWNLIFRFASNPARTLESAVAEEANAVTSFDASGHGLISIDLDGQVLQILARLSTRSRDLGVRVRAGDRVFIEEVDTQKNLCTVSPLGFGNAPKADLSAISLGAVSPGAPASDAAAARDGVTKEL